jgi:hypothetical protein
MKLIPLSKGKFAKVDDRRYDELNQRKWYFDGRYARRNVYENGKLVKRILMHRVVAGTPEGVLTDHKDGDTLNNQEANLRFCDKSKNAANQKKRPNLLSVYKGVTKDQASWQTQIWYNNKKHYSASFREERWAAMAYDLNAAALFGEYARLNFPEAISAFRE